MKKLIVLASLAIISFTACKKKENPSTTVTYTKADTLQNGKWKLTSASAAGGLIDLMTSMKDCQKDNFYTFNADKTITIDEGATKCNASDVSPRSDGNWSLSSDYKQITVSGSLISSFGLGISSITGDLVSINTTGLEIKKDTTFSGIPTSIVIKFSNTK